MSKRHEMKWLPGNHEGEHNECDCDLEVSFPSIGLPTMIAARFQGRRRTIAEMYSEVKAMIISNYYLATGENGKVVKAMAMNEEMYLNYMREYNTPSSQIAIQPPVLVQNAAVAVVDPIVTTWRGIQELAERSYWKDYYPPVNNIKDRFFPVDETVAIPTLQALCAKRMSWTQTVYEKWYGCKRVVNARENMGVAKALRLYSDFCQETASRTAEDIQVFKYVPAALGSLLRAMNTYDNHAKLTFQYNPVELIKKVSLFTSAGVLPGARRKTTWEGAEVQILNTGKKCYLVEQAVRKLHRILHQIKTNPTLIVEAIHCLIKLKDEFRYGQYKIYEELLAMLMKMREFFIPDLPHVLMSIIVNEKRMLLERNNVIRIGMKFWWGGSYFLYKFLNGDQKDFYWVDGDIEGLDKHIQDWQLLLYCSNVYPYYAWDTMNGAEQEFLRKLLEYWATNVCAKLVCHIGGFWRFMNGQMYSGGKETSHGDSWIMAFIFYCFCEHIKAMHPMLADLIDRFIMMMFIVIVVYGDDHIWGAPNLLRSVMNHVTWGQFLKTYFHMNLRDANIYDSLISVPDGMGRFAKKGPKFLKRYFIENKDERYAPILPYKEIDESVCKFFTTEFDTTGEMIPVAIGHAWDSMGTNEPFYNIVLHVYRSLMALKPLTPAELLQIYEADTHSVKFRRLLRKVNVPRSEFFKFPSLECMMARHVLDAAKASYSVPFDQLERAGTILEFEDEDWNGFVGQEEEE